MFSDFYFNFFVEYSKFPALYHSCFSIWTQNKRKVAAIQKITNLLRSVFLVFTLFSNSSSVHCTEILIFSGFDVLLHQESEMNYFSWYYSLVETFMWFCFIWKESITLNTKIKANKNKSKPKWSQNQSALITC